MGAPISGDPIGDVAVKAGQALGEGAAVTYQRLRQAEKDEVSSSEEAAALAAYAAIAGNPIISPPSAFGQTEASVLAVSPLKRAKTASLIESKMAAELMEAWATAVHQAGEKRHDLETSPIYRAQEAYWREFRNSEHPSAYSTAHSVTATLSIGAVFISLIGPTGRSESHISYNSVADSMQQITPLIAGPGDMRAELGLIGATLAYGAVFQASWITAGQFVKAPEKGEKLTLQFATNYSDRLLAQCKDPAFDALLTTLITEHMGTQPIPPEKMKEMVAMVKLGMLLSAAALFYQADTGGQSGLEVTAYLRPDAPPMDPSNPRAKLVAQMHELLGSLQGSARETVLEKMLAFLDEHKSVKSLTDPAAILLGILGGDASFGVGGAIVAA